MNIVHWYFVQYDIKLSGCKNNSWFNQLFVLM